LARRKGAVGKISRKEKGTQRKVLNKEESESV
jgi:hypothetical protein